MIIVNCEAHFLLWHFTVTLEPFINSPTINGLPHDAQRNTVSRALACWR
jgi:hypothetical protein